MLARSSATWLARRAIGMAMIAAAGCTIAAAQSPQAPGPTVPYPPPGFSVTPARPQAQPLIPDGRRAPSGEAPESRQEPSQYPQGGGCRYQEGKLELIV